MSKTRKAVLFDAIIRRGGPMKTKRDRLSRKSVRREIALELSKL